MTDSELKWLETTSNVIIELEGRLKFDDGDDPAIWWKRACKVAQDLKGHEDDQRMVAVPAPMLVALVDEVCSLKTQLGVEWDQQARLKEDLKAAREEADYYKRLWNQGMEAKKEAEHEPGHG